MNKERNLLEDPEKHDVCLNDLIMDLAAMTQDAATLEYSASNMKALRKHKKDVRDFEKTFLAYKKRLKDEVTPEIVAFLDGKPKAKSRGRSENIIEYNERRKAEKLKSENSNQ